MSRESHERARMLIAADRVEGISTDERRWLSGHLEDWAESSGEANALAGTIQSLRTLNVIAGDAMVRRASLGVHHRAEEIRLQRERAASLWIAATWSSVWAILTAPIVWFAFAWF